MFCTRCGASNPDDAGFCAACGRPLQASSAQTPPSSQPASQPPAPETSGPSSSKPIVPLVAGIVAIGAIAAAVYFFVLSGGDDGSLFFDPALAEELAQSAMIGPDDLTDGDWTVSQVDEFETDERPDVASCNAVRDKEDALDSQTQSQRAGRAQRQFKVDLPGMPDVEDLSVDVQVDVYDDEETAKMPVEELRPLVASSDWSDCARDTVSDSYRSAFSFNPDLSDIDLDVNIETLDATPRTEAPEDGVSYVVELASDASSDDPVGTGLLEATGLTSTSVRQEGYVWRTGNAVVSVTISGQPEDVTPELVNRVTNAVQTRVQQAASANPPAPVLVVVTLPPLDPGQASDLARQVLLSPPDMPTSGWVIADESGFTGFYNWFELGEANVASCAGLPGQALAVDALLNSKLTGGGERDLTLDIPSSSLDLNLTVAVSFYRNAVDLPRAVSALGSIYASSALLPCFEDSLVQAYEKALTSSGLDLQILGSSSRAVSPSAVAPGGGVSAAYDISVDIESLDKIGYRADEYVWQYENAVVSVLLSGPADQVTPALVDYVLAEVQRRLEALPRTQTPVQASAGGPSSTPTPRPTNTPVPTATPEGVGLVASIDPVPPDEPGTTADRLLGSSNPEAADALTQALIGAGANLTGIRISVFSVTGTDYSLVVMRIDEALGANLGDDPSPFIFAMLSAPAVQENNITRFVANYHGADGFYTLTLPVSTLLGTSTGALGQEQLLADLLYEVR